MEAHEEVDIVIGEKKEFLCDTVTHADRNVIQRFYFFASGKIWGFSISVWMPSNGRYNLHIFDKNKKSEKLYP